MIRGVDNVLDFLSSVINYFHQYTLADTANMFAIVEGTATVVAAIGAVIAVVITKKIASKQIEIAIEQNKISNKQAEIASQQNKIALLEKRASIYDTLFKFMNYWYCFSKPFLESLAKIPSINSLQAYLSIRELNALDVEYIKNKDLYELVIKHSNLVIKDIDIFSQTYRLFYLPESLKATLVGVMEEYKKFSMEIHALRYPDYSTQTLEERGNSLFILLDSQSWRDLLDYLESQISFNGYEDQA